MAKFPAEREMQRARASWSHEISGDNKTVILWHVSLRYQWTLHSFFLFYYSDILKKKRREDEERHFHSTQRKVGLKEVKWIVLPHFSFWDFLVSVNNRPSARTSHTCKHTPLSTSPPRSALRGAAFPPVRGVGWGQGGRPELPATWNASPHGSCTPSPPGSVRQVFVSLINLFGVLFHLLRFHIYKIQSASPSHRTLSNETTHFPAFESPDLSWTFSSAHVTEEKTCVHPILSNRSWVTSCSFRFLI